MSTRLKEGETNHKTLLFLEYEYLVLVCVARENFNELKLRKVLVNSFLIANFLSAALDNVGELNGFSEY